MILANLGMYFMFLTILANTCAAEECTCYSRFDYEEKLLEKVIRTDIQMQQVLEKLETVMGTIEVQRRELEGMKTKVESSSEVTQEAVSNKMKNLRKQILKLQDSMKTPSIAFNVREAADKSPTAGQIMVYQTVVLNFGNAFDIRTGIFTSPVNGTFLFSVQICTSFRETGSVKVVTDDLTLVGISNYNYISGVTSTSGSAVHKLREGQKVWVENEYDSASSSNLVDSDHERACWNQFTGALLDLDLQ